MGRPANDAPTRFTAAVRGRKYSRARWRGRVVHLGPSGSAKAEKAWADLLRRVADDPGGDADLDAGEVLVPELFARYLESPDAPKTARGRMIAALAGRTLCGDGPPGVAGTPGHPDLGSAGAAAVTGKDWKKWRRWLCCLPRVDGRGEPRPGETRYAASSVRDLVRAAVRAYQWAASEGLIPPAALAAAETAAALASGTPRANRKRSAADPAHVAAARAGLRPPLRAAVDLMLLTAGRPAEVLRINPAELHKSGVVDVPGFGRCDLDAAGVWVFTPRQHKTAHKGLTKAVWFTREAQAVLAPWLAGLAPDDCAFSPARDLAARFAEKRAAAKAPYQPRPSRAAGRAPRRPPGDRYESRAFWAAVKRACRAAAVPVWSPYQLRHLAKRTIEERYGVETARVFLGHSKTSTTDIYGGLSFERVKAAAVDAPRPAPESPHVD